MVLGVRVGLELAFDRGLTAAAVVRGALGVRLRLPGSHGPQCVLGSTCDVH
ncbi:MAG TPA: hypothetical protein VN253_15155 [Kofleriaceae bacterium]|nr:hypothetical protein [Kofleriaceae bacterium]